MLKIPELKMTLQTEPFPPTPLLTLSPPPGGAHPGTTMVERLLYHLLSYTRLDASLRSPTLPL